MGYFTKERLFSKTTFFPLAIVLALAISVPILPSNTGADEVALSLPSAINIAGRQRMLSQRMVKFYCMVGLMVDEKNSREKMQAAEELFDRQLVQLQNIKGVDGRLSQTYIRDIAADWDTVKGLLHSTPTAKRAHTLRDAADQLLAKSHAFVQELESISGSSQGHLVNVAGRQRMLSQRIAGYYMEQLWDVQDDHMMLEKDKAQEEFESALTMLQDAQENTKEISEKLRLVSGQWHAFTAINSLEDKAYAQPLLVSQASDTILATMNDVTALYQHL